MFKFEETGLYGKDAMDKAIKSYATTSKGLQAIFTETSDYAKKSFESSFAHLQTMMGVKSFDSAVELQTAYAKSAMQSYMAQISKLGEMYSDIAKEAYEPAKSAVATATELVKTKAEKAPVATSVAA